MKQEQYKIIHQKTGRACTALWDLLREAQEYATGDMYADVDTRICYYLLSTIDEMQKANKKAAEMHEHW